MAPSPSARAALFCLGLCLRQVVQAQGEPLPAPTLQALPSALVPLDKPVNLLCQGPPGVTVYRLEKLRLGSDEGKYEDKDSLYIPAMRQRDAGLYRCSYQKGSRWSSASEKLKLVATGVFKKPTLSAQPGPAVPPGGDVTLQCRSQYSFHQYALYKKGHPGQDKGLERWYQADFPIITVTAAHSGTYRCYSFPSNNPYLWSAPSDPLELMVTGPSSTASPSPTEAPSSTTPPSRDTTTSPRGPDSTTGLTHQDYTRGNVIRLCLGAAIILILVGILVEDWHSRKKFPLLWVPAVHRPLPPLPQAPKSQGSLDGGRPAGHPQGLPPSEPHVVVSKRS
uniref:Glycoprotein VI platelet n=1 Tax=Pipistrellus kuhlii TaxID=59472 RepID=A0A7J7QZX0_PIPKU|nr:glycoprotein VI platelet [Pipistrellus kuhlii]